MSAEALPNIQKSKPPPLAPPHLPLATPNSPPPSGFRFHPSSLLQSLLLLLLFLAPVLARANEAHYQWTVSGGNATITNYVGPGGAVVIPDTLDGHPVRVIGDRAFLNNTLITSVVIPDSVTSIAHGSGSWPRGAFNGCTKLASVTIGNSVTNIGNGAFYDCTALVSVVIPDSVTSIGDVAFFGCMSMEGVTIPDSVTSIGGWAFSDCKSLTKVVIPNSVTNIGVGAFSHTLLESVVIPDGVTMIERDTFFDCTLLTNVVIHNSVTNIGDSAFEGCTSLESVTIPASVISIEREAFEDCSSLWAVYFEGNAPIHGFGVFSYVAPKAAVYYREGTMGWEAMYAGLPTAVWTNYPDPMPMPEVHYEIAVNYSNGYGYATITEYVGPGGAVSIPSNLSGFPVKEIGYTAFLNNTAITSVEIPDSVTSIADGGILCYGDWYDPWDYVGIGAFYGCTNLTSVTIPNSVTNIGASAFWGCTSLTNVVIPHGVTHLGDGSFRECTALTSLPIPDSVTQIDAAAFLGCTSLTNIVIPHGVTWIDWGTFYGCSSLKTIIIHDNVKYICEKAFSECLSLESVVIGNGVTTIGYEAFFGCTSLTSATIPDSVTSIGYGAFSNCTSLDSVTIGNSVTNIGDWAFHWCTSLDAVYFLGNAPSHGNNVFSWVAPGATAYYREGTTDWEATYAGLPTAPFYIVDASAGAHGTIEPSGEVFAGMGEDQLFTFLPNEWYGVDEVLKNGQPLGAPSSYLWTNVTADGSIAVSFAPLLVTNNTPVPVPQDWMARFGLTNNMDELIHQDISGVGATTWQLFVMDANPTSGVGVLRMDNIPLGENQRMEWYASSNRLYTLLWGSNLVSGVTNVLMGPIQPAESGWYMFEDESAGDEEQGYYRIKVTIP